MTTKTRALPTFDIAHEGEGGPLASFDLHGFVDAETVEAFLAEMTHNPDEYLSYGCVGEDSGLPSWWGGFEVEHLWRTTECDPDMHEPDEECVCDWKEWHYTPLPADDSEAIFTQPGATYVARWKIARNPGRGVPVTRLTPVREGLHGQRCYAHPFEPATSGLPKHYWPEPVVLNPQRYTVLDGPQTITEKWQINRMPEGSVLLDDEGGAWQAQQIADVDGHWRSPIRWVSGDDRLTGNELVERHAPLRILSEPDARRYLYACRDCTDTLHAAEKEQTAVRVAEIERLDGVGVGHLFWGRG